MRSERSIGIQISGSAADTDYESAESRQSCADKWPENRPLQAGNCATETNRLKIGNPICSANVLFAFLQHEARHIDSNR